MEINNWCFDEFYEKQITEKEKETLIAARVIESHRDYYHVISDRGEKTARLKGSSFRKDGLAEELPVTGDFVLVKANDQGEDIIYRVLDRKTYFSRLNPATRQTRQMVAANFDYVLILTSLNNDFNSGRIERYITEGWQSGATPLIVLTKKDLLEECGEQIRKCMEAAPGVEIFAVSAVTGEGMEALKANFKPGTTAVLLGSSGVGKSSLINALAGENIMETKEIREADSKGHHTTTHRQLIRIPGSIWIMDTPGMRELGVYDAREGLSETFGEVEQLFESCRFRNCSHTKELGCAVLEALEKGELDPKRWKNYLALQREIAHSERKKKMSELKSQKTKKLKI